MLLNNLDITFILQVELFILFLSVYRFRLTGLKRYHSRRFFLEKFRTHQHPSQIVFPTQNFFLTCRFIFFHSLDLADSQAAKPLHGVSQIVSSGKKINSMALVSE
jgi:hypothetical protein